MDIETEIALIANDIPFDGLFAGAGLRKAGGTIEITAARHLHNIDSWFVEGYKQVAEYDVVARLFYHYPDLVQRVAVADYARLKVYQSDADAGGRADGEKIAKYLTAAGICHLMLVGLESNAGLAWLTFYRRADQPFSAAEADTARYLVPAALYRWQRTLVPKVCCPPLTPTSIGLLPLSVLEVDVMFRKSNGMGDKDIARDLGMTTSAVDKTLRALRKRLGADYKRLTHDLIRKYQL